MFTSLHAFSLSVFFLSPVVDNKQGPIVLIITSLFQVLHCGIFLTNSEPRQMIIIGTFNIFLFLSSKDIDKLEKCPLLHKRVENRSAYFFSNQTTLTNVIIIEFLLSKAETHNFRPFCVRGDISLVYLCPCSIGKEKY